MSDDANFVVITVITYVATLAHYEIPQSILFSKIDQGYVYHSTLLHQIFCINTPYVFCSEL